ncbi:MAG TPA: fibronectin type III domain-containing protein, partial [Thermoplasmata archaeon]|nr:fibronectin type III domain-containing protein [Thermoplasmata archaeon]
HLTLILTTGALYDHDLWSDSQSLVATLSFYEANNVYWEPYLNGYVNVQADGATGDRVEEWQLNGPTGYSLSQTFTGNWGSGRVINGVNGIALNRTSETLSFALGAASGANTVVAALNQSGTITGFTSVLEERAGITQLGPASASDRPTLVTSGPDLQAYYDGFYNASWLVEMTPGHLGYETTNLSGAFPYGGNPPQYAWPQWSQEGEYYNTSYLIAPSSYACNSQFHSACTINGSGGVAVGTLWWYWQLGQPRFPNPSTAPMDENSSPGITTVTGANVTASSVALNWTTAAGSDVLSYTLEWGTNRSFGHVVGIGGANTSYTLVGLASDTRYYFALQAWNLHYAGGSAGISTALTNGPPTPTGLSVLSTTNSSVTWNWTEPAGGSILNNTLYVFAGGTCVGTPTAFSTGGPATQEMVGGLAAGTSYSAEVTSWNAFGQSTVSSCVSATTLPNPLPTYEVTFAETGLPAEDAWYLNITGGPALASVGAVTTVNATLSNGTYPYVLTTNDPTWSPSYAHNFTVDGGPLSVDVSFVPVTYPVTFTESGLPLGTPWTVTVGTGANVSNSSTHVVRETNGTYPYALSDISGWHQTTLPYTGSITVHGAAVVEPALVYRPFTYPVSFDEAGLPATDGWYVNITGQPSLVATGAMSSLPTELANGTYTVRISTDDKTYAPSFTPTLQVNGAPVSTRIEFTLVTYTVTFRQTGLAAGTSWNVTVDGVSRSSVTPAIVFVEPNGSYRFTVGKVPGYSFSPTNGWMNVSGGNATASVTFSRSPAGSTFLGLSVTEGYLLVGGVLAVGVALGLVWGRSRRRRTSTFDPGQGSRPDRAPPGPG